MSELPYEGDCAFFQIGENILKTFGWIKFVTIYD